jgi:hypothetical protein
MKIEFKNGFVVMDGIETTISKDYWKEREEGIKTRRKALKIGMKILTDSKLREKLKDLVGEFDVNSF